MRGHSFCCMDFINWNSFCSEERLVNGIYFAPKRCLFDFRCWRVCKRYSPLPWQCYVCKRGGKLQLLMHWWFQWRWVSMWRWDISGRKCTVCVTSVQPNNVATVRSTLHCFRSQNPSLASSRNFMCGEKRQVKTVQTSGVDAWPAYGHTTTGKETARTGKASFFG